MTTSQPKLRLALVQFNPVVGEIASNARRILDFAHKAREEKCDLVVFPELALTGYPPRDLLLQGGFILAVLREARELAARARELNLTLVLGTPWPVGLDAQTALNPASDLAGLTFDPARLHNSLLYAGASPASSGVYHKRLLPTYDVFDEDRYFEPGSHPRVISVPLRTGSTVARVGLSICEDLWRGEDAGFAARYLSCPDPLLELLTPPDGTPGAQIIVNPSASPYRLGMGARQRALLSRVCRTHAVPVAAVNQVGANDELIFDGGACVYHPAPNTNPAAASANSHDAFLTAVGPLFDEALVVCDIAFATTAASAAPIEVADPLVQTVPEEQLFRALTLGVRDYCAKTGFKRVAIGLSGGIDSALTAVIAVAALGSPNVVGLSMPSRYSSEGSKTDAAELAANLSMVMHTATIEPAFIEMNRVLSPIFANLPQDVTEENLQSRIRGTLLMAVSNKLGALVLTTGNKSEMAVGYATLYGDMNGGLAVLSDVTKQWVYRLSRWINANPARLNIPTLAPAALRSGPIPPASITKPPSAELRPDQKDQDTLPPYEILDEIIERYVEKRQAPSAIIAAMRASTDEATIRKVVRMIDLSEFKRKQAATGLKVTSVAFGSGRRMPIAQRWREDTPAR
jgi:NAD+ synthase (glutamine-hydrolysing)